MAKLYELTENYRQLVAQIEDMDLSPETMLDTLEGSSELMSIEEKAGNIVRMVKNWESELPGIESEIKRLTANKKTIENRVDSIKSYLKLNMESVGLEKIKVDTFTISLRNNPVSLKINNENYIPDEYLTIIPESFVPNKADIKNALKAGKEVAGCELSHGRSLNIK